MQPKRPRFNPLILALALAGVLMIWSVLGTSDSSTGGSTMSYSTVVHYFENNQVTAYTLDRNTSIITLTLKEGKQELPETTGAAAATQASGGTHRPSSPRSAYCRQRWGQTGSARECCTDI